jgi:hypothetical protein
MQTWLDRAHDEVLPPPSIRFRDSLALTSPQLANAYRQMIRDHVAILRTLGRLGLLTNERGSIFHFSDAERAEIYDGFERWMAAFPLQSEQAIYRIGFLTMNGAPGVRDDDLWSLNVLCFVAMARSGRDSAFRPADEAALIARWRDVGHRLISRAYDREIYQSRWDEATKAVVGHFDGSGYEREINFFLSNLTRLRRPVERKIWGLAALGTPTQMVFSPEYRQRIPAAFVADPTAFISRLKPFQRKQDSPLDQIGYVGHIRHGVTANPLIPGDDHEKFHLWKLPDGETLFVKKINPLRIRWWDEEITLARAVNAALQSVDARFHAASFVGMVYDKGNFYVLSKWLQGNALQNTSEEWGTESTQIQNVLTVLGVGHSRGRARTREILKTGQNDFYVVDFESLPFEAKESGVVTAPTWIDQGSALSRLRRWFGQTLKKIFVVTLPAWMLANLVPEALPVSPPVSAVRADVPRPLSLKELRSVKTGA